MRELVQDAFCSPDHDHFSLGRHFLELRDSRSALRLAAFVTGARLSGAGLSDDIIRGGAAIDMAARALALQERLTDTLACPPGENRAILVLGADWNLAASAALCGALPAATRDIMAGECLALFERRFRGAAAIRVGRAAGQRLTADEYLAVARDTTGAVFAALTSIAALLGGAPATVREALARTGENIGIAVRILDDPDPAAVPGGDPAAAARRHLDLAAAPVLPALDREFRHDLARLLSVLGRPATVEVGT
jgi:octaprenyl-diphosphate synthase